MISHKSKKLINNVGIFAIGNLGSKLISFILIPIFTRYMPASEFGHVDIITTTVNMLLPIVSLSIADAVFRFVMDKNANQTRIFTTGLIFNFVMIVISLVSYPILKLSHVAYAGYILLYLSAGLLQLLLQNFVRGIGYIRLFAINGLTSSIVLAGVGIWRIVFQHAGVIGYLDALISSTLVSIIFLITFSSIWRFITFTQFNLQMLRTMLIYSVPLIPNSFLWFFTNDASRYFIVGFLGLTANGLYAVATKIPTIINVFYTVFAQAWQISAVEEYENDRDGDFFSTIFNANVGLSVILIGGILVVLKPVMSIFVASSYFLAWQIVPSLLFASFFSNLSSFLGTIYLATKKTGGIMKTTVYGMIVNILLNCTLVPIFGLQGAGIGAALGFAFIAGVRLIDVRKFVKLNIAWVNLEISIGLMILMSLIQFVFNNHGIIQYTLLAIFELILIIINVNYLIKSRQRN
ncbi:lipopolysaccharide biosynthesis protein [Lactiplantibacillus plantarum]|uniref:lipopolysaccharide biosynthesis protein n=6 Tax=Lactiplantibacillus plantarum TaxID=1590 RepID=UPI0006A5EB9C|nr:lipopolysaccharide biosynthesis protein [Lactiplantibacillus plantarum]AXI12235.1 lipopolysaccharide biosynthesis protein [Lactiplantibacillus plantarum]KOE73544.1 glycosyl transferase [Lactiplantibacillus plantarum]MBW1620551.1 lipopolysaccharide biosynthesis protein [Lactiplantibacillus plantarum]MBW4807182.1 lipopolysaccharide biosynthesis protein [Lactiplantibacillus plantarum]MCG0691292.1 lipopolysaccharide biosynthesis protein [Lactiplantibacillus plantarum]